MASTVDLVVECCRSGVIGAFPALNARDNAGYRAWLNDIRERLARHANGAAAAPFGVNLSMRRGNPRLENDLATTIAERVPLVITSLGVSADVVERVHAYGGIVFHDVVNRRHAEKAAAAGVDGLILVAAGAGGHAGLLNPFAFVAETRRWFDRTLILAGGIVDGRQIAAAELLGADMVSIGTRFIATREGGVPPAYKEMILAAGADDIVYTAAMTGVGASFLKASLRAWGLDPGDLTTAAIDAPTRTVRHGDRQGKVWRDVWSAGQGAGAIDDLPGAAELCGRLAAEYAVARESRPMPAPLAEETRAILAAMPAREPIWRDGVAAARAAQDDLASRRAPGPPVAVVRDVTISGPGGALRLRLYRPDMPSAAIVYCHGGGWVMGGIDDSDAHTRRMAVATGCAVVSVGYRLAPEARFPAALDDVLAAWRWTVRDDPLGLGRGLPCGVAGDSAGGNLAAAATLALRAAGETMPAFQVLGYPVLSAAMDTRSYRDQRDGPVLSAADMRWFWDQYVPDPADRRDPRAAPLDEPDLAGLPPTRIFTAACDPLRDEDEDFARRLSDAAVDVDYRCYPGMIHGFYKMADVLAGGRAALADTARFIRERCPPARTAVSAPRRNDARLP